MKQVGLEKRVDGKEFVTKLDDCRTLDEVIALLRDTMSEETIRDRLDRMSDNDLVIALKAQAARVNVGFRYKTTHEELLIMAADKYQKMTGGEEGEKTKNFKKSLKKALNPFQRTITQAQLLVQERQRA